MTAHRLFALTAAVSTFAIAAPALAQSDPGYQYAEPVPEGEVVFRSDPVIQSVPGAIVTPPVEIVEVEGVAAPAAPHSHPGHPMSHSATPYPPQHHAVPHAGPAYPYPAPHHVGHLPAPPRFDREAWLADCRDRIRGVDRRDRAGVIGGLLGAVAGGVIGNRAWDSERLAGTLLGAGVGGLAGLAIGSAIGAAGNRRREDECAMYLDRYMAAGQPGYGYGHPAYGYGYGYAYPAIAYVPVLVQVPQRAVVREYVTEEWVDVPAKPHAKSHSTTQTKIIRQPAPAPRADKRTKLIKAK
ncbi:hypothetical protein A6F68_00466 [Tsuneonella dongtanensis]|uniref:17 kDa surface antigen n=1 Tax=Tsuneonella dongtanensis TaxID=692370 RepID=A0A1B2AA69_9SPHN|nr:glycine zipper 2TM domain-containing protein [Tsuneonella dongtanensis]ANY19001.1 hypothetical protein A6F68_00466 [Tsuneonella dongtanensis]